MRHWSQPTANRPPHLVASYDTQGGATDVFYSDCPTGVEDHSKDILTSVDCSYFCDIGVDSSDSCDMCVESSDSCDMCVDCSDFCAMILGCSDFCNEYGLY